MTKPYCYHSLDQVRESGLIAPERMAAITAEIESRISEPRTATGQPITTAKLATFPDGKLMLYPRMDHDPDGAYMRRELLSAILTPEELKTINDHCSAAWSAAADARRFERATKLDSWDGWVTDGDNYWCDVESYLDEHFDEFEDGLEEAVPLYRWVALYVWVAVRQRIIPDLDVAGVVGHWIDNRGWEDMSTDDLNGVAALQAALDDFVRANKSVIGYIPDYTRAVLLNAYLKNTSI